MACRYRGFLQLAVTLTVWAVYSSAIAADAPIDFDRQIRPILSDNCFACHGPDAKARKANLRLDVKESVFSPTDSGERPVVPGNAKASELLRRDREHRSRSAHAAGQHEQDAQGRGDRAAAPWIEQGATWREHWAFVPPKRPALPAVKNAAWPRNADRPLHPGPAGARRAAALAARPTRRRSLRRVTLDLTGLPPTLGRGRCLPGRQLAAAPTRRWSIGCCSRRATASTWPASGSTPPATATRTACTWTTTARCGRTATGSSGPSTATCPSTASSIEQLAGDLLPNPTLDQLVATGFNRCHVTTSEGGSIEEEVYVRNVVDRVDTTGTVFLGLTVGCARCHDHKYDPITQKDFYSLFAFFNSLDGKPLDGNIGTRPRWSRVPTPEQERADRGDAAADRRDVAERSRTASPPTSTSSRRSRPR